MKEYSGEVGKHYLETIIDLFWLHSVWKVNNSSKTLS